MSNDTRGRRKTHHELMRDRDEWLAGFRCAFNGRKPDDKRACRSQQYRRGLADGKRRRMLDAIDG